MTKKRTDLSGKKADLAALTLTKNYLILKSLQLTSTEITLEGLEVFAMII